MKTKAKKQRENLLIEIKAQKQRASLLFGLTFLKFGNSFLNIRYDSKIARLNFFLQLELAKENADISIINDFENQIIKLEEIKEKKVKQAKELEEKIILFFEKGNKTEIKQFLNNLKNTYGNSNS
jgi:hypothetical protein